MSTDGGQAFPTFVPETDQRYAEAAPGMTLRDYFAAKALAGLTAFPGHVVGGTTLDGIAARSYAYADAMLAQRAQALR